MTEAGYGKHASPGTTHEDSVSLTHGTRKGDTSPGRTRHTRTRRLLTKDFAESGKLKLEHCPTEDMTAGTLTKPLQGKLLFRLRDLTLGYTTRAKKTQT